MLSSIESWVSLIRSHSFNPQLLSEREDISLVPGFVVFSLKSLTKPHLTMSAKTRSRETVQMKKRKK